MKLWITLEGRDAEVEFHATEGKLFIEIEGHKADADFRRLPDGEVYSLLVNGRSLEVRVAPAGERLLVSHAGVTLPVEVRHPLEKILQAVRRAETTRAGETVSAPMPGLVVALRVKPGDRVSAGQAVVVIEAMKMQNELAARTSGVVNEVLVSERASVSAGQALLRIKAVES